MENAEKDKNTLTEKQVHATKGVFINSLWLSTLISEHFHMSVSDRRITYEFYKLATLAEYGRCQSMSAKKT